MDSSLINTINIVLGIVSILVSFSAIGISWLLYSKSDSLNKEMLKFITEIKTITNSLYTDLFELIKEPIQKIMTGDLQISYASDSNSAIVEISNEAAKKVDERLTNELENIANGDKMRGNELEQLKLEVQELIQKIPAKVTSLQEEKENAIELKIMDYVAQNEGVKLSIVINIISRELNMPVHMVKDAAVRLYFKGRLCTKRDNEKTFSLNDYAYLNKIDEIGC
jgi:hypothetical protein